MLAHSPRLQFVTGIPDSPKMEAKGVVLVKGSLYEILGFPGLSFNVNQPLMFSGLSPFMFWYISYFPRLWVYRYTYLLDDL